MISKLCNQCPRQCNASRQNAPAGYCHSPATLRIARAALHPWEEPPISGARGSGTVFFTGCNLRCVYCQNRPVSHQNKGRDVTEEQLAALMMRLQDEGAHNINLVTPTHYALQLAEVLKSVKPSLHIPVVYNCGGYESVDTLRHLEGLVDIYLPDVKYCDNTLAIKYSSAPNYREIAFDALREMLRQTGSCQFDGDGMMQRGVILRHLVLPGCRKDSIALLEALAKDFGTNAFQLSLMNQYTPEFATEAPYPELHRKVTTFEYESVLNRALELGFDGYFQDRASATASFTPDFQEPTF